MNISCSLKGKIIRSTKLLVGRYLPILWVGIFCLSAQASCARMKIIKGAYLYVSI